MPPPYVDDLLALLWGPEQTLEATVLLIFLGHAAGLRIEAHHCTTVRAAQVDAEGAARLRATPLRMNWDGDVLVAAGLPADLMGDLILAAAPQAVILGQERPGRCQCKVKSVVLPAHGFRCGKKCTRTPLSARLLSSRRLSRRKVPAARLLRFRSNCWLRRSFFSAH